jgi:hypothetical protein
MSIPEYTPILLLTVKATVTPILLLVEAVNGLSALAEGHCAPINTVYMLSVPKTLNEIHPICYAHHDRVCKVH